MLPELGHSFSETKETEGGSPDAASNGTGGITRCRRPEKKAPSHDVGPDGGIKTFSPDQERQTGGLKHGLSMSRKRRHDV